MTDRPRTAIRRQRLDGDDAVLPFRTVRSAVEGRLVRLAATADTILGGHDYPEAVKRVLGEALALTAMLGTALKPGGRLILEARTDGPLRSLAVNFEIPIADVAVAGGRMRGYAGFDAAAVAARVADSAGHGLLGDGHLALTIEPGPGRDSYQGVTALDGGTLSDAARAYFRQSEQIPTFIRLVVARELAGRDLETATGAAEPAWLWRVGGLMIQHLAAAGVDDAGDGAASSVEGDDALPASPTLDAADAEEDWRRVRLLAETVEDHELIDPSLPPARLLYRLFHEEGVRVREAVPIETYCRCSRERIAGFLEQFGAAELADLRGDDGNIVVTCEFCGESYAFPDQPTR